MTSLVTGWVFVTGAGAGIGRAVARAVAARGAGVACFDRDGPAADETAELVRRAGSQSVAIEGDVRDRAAVQHAVELGGRLGPLWGVVANAGTNHHERFLDFDFESWRRVLDVNLSGVFNTCQLGARQLVAQGTGGRIVTIASVAAVRPYEERIAYVASKAAVRHMTAAIAQELAPYGVTANSIGPGSVDTGWNESMRADRWRSPAVPLGRSCRPEEVAALAVYLLGDDAAYMTGGFLLLDGGRAGA